MIYKALDLIYFFGVSALTRLNIIVKPMTLKIAFVFSFETISLAVAFIDSLSLPEDFRAEILICLCVLKAESKEEMKLTVMPFFPSWNVVSNKVILKF